MTRLTAQEDYWDLQVPNTNNYVTVDGTIHHNSGKSVCCAHELMRMAQDQPPNRQGRRCTRFLVVRNTADQLRSTTLKTIKDWFPPTEGFGRWAATERTLYYTFGMDDGTIVETEWMLRALDDEADIANALSLEVTAMWGNESREMHPAVVAALLKRTNRYPSKKSGGGFAKRAGAIFDTNPPAMETWWESRISDPPENWSVHLQQPAILPLAEWIERYGEDPHPSLCARSPSGIDYVVDPNADNIGNLSPRYYPDAVRSDKDDDIDVYLRGKFGRTLGGLPVYDKTFRYNVHVASGPLRAIHSDAYPLCIGVDFGRTPAAVITQNTPSGQTLVLAELYTEAQDTMGMQSFITRRLKPMLLRFPGHPCYVAADPAGWQKSQGNEKAPVDYLKEAGFKVVKPRTNNPRMRIEHVETLLNQSADAKPRVQIDPACKMLIKGFRGAYKWATNRQGELSNDAEPVKNHPHSDLADSLQYAFLVIDGNHSGGSASSRRTVEVANPRGWT